MLPIMGVNSRGNLVFLLQKILQTVQKIYYMMKQKFNQYIKYIENIIFLIPKKLFSFLYNQKFVKFESFYL